jgi:membrane associated rhomboid family serine protease
MGASCGVSAILCYYILNNPYTTIYVYFFPVPAWAFGVAFMGYSWLSMNSPGSVGHAGHFGGGLFGAMLYAAVKYKFKR